MAPRVDAEQIDEFKIPSCVVVTDRMIFILVEQTASCWLPADASDKVEGLLRPLQHELCIKPVVKLKHSVDCQWEFKDSARAALGL